MHRAFLLLFFISSSFLHADLATIDRAMSDYEGKLDRWERSFLAAETPDLKRKILTEKPDSRLISQSIMRQLSPMLNEPSAMRAIAWIYKHDPSFLSETGETSPGKIIRTSLNRYHYKHAGAGALCVAMSQNFSPSDMEFLEKVSAQSPSKTDQGLGALAISIALSGIGDETALLAKRLEQLKKAITLLPPETMVEGVKASDIIDDQIYVIKNLTKGRTAPALSGYGVGGKEVHWQAGTGKVTVLLFWNDKNLAQDSLLSILKDTDKLLGELGGEMVGVYSGDLMELRTRVADREVTWKNIVDSEKTVTEQYRINKTPTMFVLDKKGQIQSISEPNALVNLSIRALANTTE